MMKTQRPRAIRVIARDEETGKSRATTVYDSTPDEVISRFTSFLESLNAPRPAEAGDESPVAPSGAEGAAPPAS